MTKREIDRYIAEGYEISNMETPLGIMVTVYERSKNGDMLILRQDIYKEI